MTNSEFNSPAPHLTDALISCPSPHILLITLNRPKALNCLNTTAHTELAALYDWYDSEPSLRCAILTGSGRAFCAGADLKEWNATLQSSSSFQTNNESPEGPGRNFGGLSRRTGKKPVICAVNGIAFGGGCEMIINADMVIADENAQFALPEVKIGVIALAGALPRLVRTVGKQRAMEMALTGRTLNAQEAKEWGLVNKVVGKRTAVDAAIEMARMVAGNSPDSVIVSKKAIDAGWEGMGVEEATKSIINGLYKKIEGGDNQKEGVLSFSEKRKPRWVNSKL